MMDGRVRLYRRLEASRTAIARGMAHSQRAHTRERRDRSCANAYERHETHGEGEWT
jgi:hypothetical protein